MWSGKSKTDARQSDIAHRFSFLDNTFTTSDDTVHGNAIQFEKCNSTVSNNFLFLL